MRVPTPCRGTPCQHLHELLRLSCNTLLHHHIFSERCTVPPYPSSIVPVHPRAGDRSLDPEGQKRDSIAEQVRFHLLAGEPSPLIPLRSRSYVERASRYDPRPPESCSQRKGPSRM